MYSLRLEQSIAAIVATCSSLHATAADAALPQPADQPASSGHAARLHRPVHAALPPPRRKPDALAPSASFTAAAKTITLGKSSRLQPGGCGQWPGLTARRRQPYSASASASGSVAPQAASDHEPSGSR